MATEHRAAHETDEALGARAATGDKDAFAELYERHYGSIYDFAVRILRDREAAADVVQATFTRAWPALSEGTRPGNVRAWLFGIARNLSIDELRRRRRVFPNEGLGLGLAELPDPAAFDPSETVETKELAELVWTSAAGLRAEEYALLDLHVRRGLSADELADSLGVRRGAVYTRLTRLRAALERAVATSLLLRHGRGRCPELDRLAAAVRAQAATGATRRSLEAHVGDCERCHESKGLYASPAQILASLALVPPPEELGEAVWAIVGGVAAGAGALAASAKGAVGGALSHTPAPLGIAAGLATVATVVSLGVWVVGAGGEGSPGEASAGSPVSSAASQPPAAAPAALARPAPRNGWRETAAPTTHTAPAATRPDSAVASARSAPAEAEEQSTAAAQGRVSPRLLPPPRSVPRRVPAPPAPSPGPPPSPPPAGPAPPAIPPPSPPDPSPPPSPPTPSPAPPPPAPAPAPPSPPAPPAEERKVAVCLHGNTLVVSVSAVDGLLRAGATLGACSIT